LERAPLRPPQIHLRQRARRRDQLVEIASVETQAVILALLESGDRAPLGERLAAAFEQTREGAPRARILGRLAAQARDLIAQLEDGLFLAPPAILELRPVGAVAQLLDCLPIRLDRGHLA